MASGKRRGWSLRAWWWWIFFMIFLHLLIRRIRKHGGTSCWTEKGLTLRLTIHLLEHSSSFCTWIIQCIEQLFFVKTSSSIAADATVRWLTITWVKKVESSADAFATRINITSIEKMFMTADEFIIEGFNNAEIAKSAELNLDQAHSSFERSIWCFEQARNHKFAAKARVYHKTIQFRLDLASQRFSDDANDQTVIETKGTQIIELPISEGLLSEVMNVFYSISPIVPT